VFYNQSRYFSHNGDFIFTTKWRIGNNNKRAVYSKMNEIGSDRFYIEWYELYSCNSKEELNKREGEFIRQIATLNMDIEGRTKSEYYTDNNEKMDIKDRKHYNEHAEEIKQSKK
jgi:hypothetical protein